MRKLSELTTRTLSSDAKIEKEDPLYIETLNNIKSTLSSILKKISLDVMNENWDQSRSQNIQSLLNIIITTRTLLQEADELDLKKNSDSSLPMQWMHLITLLEEIDEYIKSFFNIFHYIIYNIISFKSFKIIVIINDFRIIIIYKYHII